MTNSKLEAEKIMVAEYRKKIIRRVNNIENITFLKFIDSMLDGFNQKWGI